MRERWIEFAHHGRPGGVATRPKMIDSINSSLRCYERQRNSNDFIYRNNSHEHVAADIRQREVKADDQGILE